MARNRWPLMKDTVTLSDRLKLSKFILTSSKLTSGPKVKKFEEEWNNWLGSDNSLFVSSGSTANFLLVDAVKEKYGWKNGDKILVPACTWVTNISPIIQLGLEPIFCDINFKNFSFDGEHVKSLASKHEDIKGIFVTHLLGYSSDIPMLLNYFPNAKLMEDVCESHGCKAESGERSGYRHCGGTFSFYFGHHMTTIEGGMVSTNDEELYNLMKVKRSHGLARESPRFDLYKKQYPDINPSFLFVTDGYNFRNTDVGAVLGSSQLKRLDKMIEIRNKNYLKYYKIISNHEDKFYIPEINNKISSFAFPFVSKNTNIHHKLIKKFEENGIEYRPVVSGNLLSQPFLSNYHLDIHRPRVEILNSCGCYIGNNHFVGEYEMRLLGNILGDL